MTNNQSNIWNEDQPRQLAEVLTAITARSTMQDFLRDVMTEKEIIEISARFEAARMLTNNQTYTEITKATKLSSRTVARISDWLQNGCDGYRAAIKLTSTHHAHIPPARAE